MDFDLIVLLLIFLAPLLSRLLKRGRPEPDEIPPSADPAGRSEPTRDPLAEALRQMREAFGDPTLPPERPAPLPADPLPVHPRPVAPPVAQRTSDFHGLGRFEHEAHGFGRENQLSEEVFEQQPAFVTTGSTARIRRDGLDEIDLTTPLDVTTARTTQPTLAKRLRDPRQAREAFVFKEIFDAPRSRRRR